MHPTRSARSACGRRVAAIVTHLSPKESKNMARKFDPVTLEILWRRLLFIVDEAAAVARTAFSSLLRDAHDYTCMFTDRQIGALVASRELYGLTEEEVRVAEGQKQNEKSIYAKHGPAQRPCPADPVL